MRRVPVVLLLICVLLAGPGTGAAVALPAGMPVEPTDDRHGAAAPGSVPDRSPASAASDPETVRELQQEFDRTEFRITVDANGSAEWTFRFKRTLENDTERRDFRTFADGFNDESTELYTDFRQRARTLTTQGANATGRPMNATDFSKRAFVNSLGNQGIVEMSFRWVAFAPVADDGTVTVGDVFEGGLYIRGDQRLVVSTGDGLAFAEASPEPDSISGDSLAGSESVTWEGERSFTDERPRIVLAPPSTATGSPTPGTTGGGDGGADGAATEPPGSPPDGTTPGAGDGGFGLLPLVGLAAVLALGLGGAFAYRSGVLGGAGTAATEPGDDGDGGGTAATAEGAGSTGGEPAPGPSIPDEELLSDEDRVMGLLDVRGGRMKQVEIVEETGWSKSKVSMLLSEMAEEGEISKLRVGRENIISKKGMEPEAAGSPFEDEDGG
ncbi:MAG: hypothetical protein V5A40_10810 [Haloarculaceae archaeon]